MEQEHKRRVHYKGTHPRNFRERYKELQPEKYTGMAEHIRQKGGTPAGTHIPICVREILDFLEIQPGQRGLDATLGYGGHAVKMLECLKGQGHLDALDVDPIEIVKTERRLRNLGYGEDILTVHSMNFADAGQLCREGELFDFVLADLGVSSMQIDNPERGFTYKAEGPLDLRLNPEKGQPAWQRMQEVTVDELEGMLAENSDEPYAREIARAVKQEQRRGRPVMTTTGMRETIGKALAGLPAGERKDAVKKSCARTFQALRIDVNSEFEVLDAFLTALPRITAPGGRIAILTFHSGEDRLVKRAFRAGKREGIYQAVAEEVIRPSASERAENPRSGSAKLRWAIRRKEREI